MVEILYCFKLVFKIQIGTCPPQPPHMDTYGWVDFYFYMQTQNFFVFVGLIPKSFNYFRKLYVKFISWICYKNINKKFICWCNMRVVEHKYYRHVKMGAIILLPESFHRLKHIISESKHSSIRSELKKIY